MTLREQLARVIARDPRYSLDAYVFVLESLRIARNRKLRQLRKRAEQERQTRPQKKTRKPGEPHAMADDPGHVTGRELSLAARRLALRAYGSMAITVLDEWGIHSTSDIGEIVYNLIASGDLDRTPQDKRSDFDNVYDFATGLRPRLIPREDLPD